MLKSLCVSTALLMASGFAQADWQLDNELSRINFVSLKKNSVAEAHYFKQASGTLDEKGRLNLSIDLASVETLIPIRNERMQQFLFETSKFPALTLTADLDKQLAGLKGGSQLLKGLKGTLNLHGQSKEISVDVLVHKAENGDLTVSSLMPVIINEGDFALADGITKLQELAGLPSIGRAVPVSFVLTLRKR